ncbi:MAG TPA: biotin/lipoyl-binding protein, partial [Smithellaceae bacterium]|nr:biotin/lipoyl-binding protein [Smithellaceae bacterium]
MARKNADYYGHIVFFIIAVAFTVFTGCGNQPAEGVTTAPVVKVSDVVIKDVAVWSEWTASTDGLVNATIRPQVQGYLLAQHYIEGDFVKKGQLLFEIDAGT